MTRKKRPNARMRSFQFWGDNRWFLVVQDERNKGLGRAPMILGTAVQSPFDTRQEAADSAKHFQIPLTFCAVVEAKTLARWDSREMTLDQFIEANRAHFFKVKL